jgi:O-antigen/teichoic acid export membrane protein
MSRIEISKRLILINSASTVLKSVLGLSVLVFVQRYLIRNVPLEEYEVLALVYPLLLVVPLLTMVVGGGLSRFVIEAYAKGDMRRVTQIASTMFPLCLGSGVLVLAVGCLITWRIDVVLDVDPRFHRDLRIMFPILFVPAAIRTTLLPFFTGLDVKQKFLFRNILGLATEVVRISILFTLLFGVSTRVLWVVVATIPGTVADIIISLAYSRRLVPELRFAWNEMRPALVRPILAFGGWTLVARASAIMREMAGPLLLNRTENSAVQVSAYRLGSYVETRFYPTVLGPLLTLQPALTGLYASGQEERLRRTYFRMSRYLLWTFLFFAIPGMVFHSEFWLVWLGEEKAAELSAGALLMVLLFAKSFFVFPQPILAQIALAKARNGPMAVRVVLMELMTVAGIAYLVLVRDMGAVGVGVATLAATMLINPLLIWSFGLKLTEASFPAFLRECLGRGLVPGLVAAPVWIGAWLLPLEANLWTLMACVLAGCAVYAVALYRLCLEPGERADVGKVFARLRGRGRS